MKRKNMTTHFSPHISLANFRVSQIYQINLIRLFHQSHKQSSPSLANQKQKRENCTCIDDGTANEFVSWKNIDCRWDVNRIFSGRNPAGLYVNHTQKQLVLLLWYERKTWSLIKPLYCIIKWAELRRWKFHTLVYSNRQPNHVTIKVKLFD